MPNKTWLLAIFLLLPLQQVWSQTPNPTYHRVISLAPHLTELIYSAGAGDKLVGRVSYSDYPPQATSLPEVGAYNAIAIEKIIQLNPDLIIAWQSGTRTADIERLRQLGFNVILSESQILTDIPNEIERFGKLLQTETIADKEAKRLRNILERLRQTYQDRHKIRAFYQIWDAPLMTVNQRQFISQAMQLCGAENVFSDLPLLAAEVNIEAVLQRDPQVILMGGEQSMQKQWFENWQRWKTLSAVKNGQIYQLNADRFHRATARLIESMDSLCEKIDQARLTTRIPVFDDK